MIGKTVAHYQIVEKVGEGGMGVVYRARDLQLNRNVAIKFLSSEVADADNRRRFQQEAQTASSLNHPHILTVFEAGELDGRQYLVTEYIDGSTLREWARRSQPSERQILQLLIGPADGLACAHQAGIIHRDIKPENILVSKDGYAKITDFGLAKLVDHQSAADSTTLTMETSPGMIRGTIPYMSPEQAGGMAMDARSDIFSFGVMLYELLAGQRPFTGQSHLVVLQAILHSTPPSLSDRRPNIQAELRTVVEKALEKDPAERYQSMRELAVDLKRALRPKPQQARRDREPRRSFAWLAVGAIAAVVLAAGLDIWFRQRPDSSPANPLANAEFSRLTDWEGTELDAAISPDGKMAAFLSDHDGIFDAWISQIGSGTFVNLTKGRFPALVHEAIRSIGFSGDGTYVWLRIVDPASKGGQGADSMWIVPAMAAAVPRRFLSAAANVAWSPDGTRIAYFVSQPGDPIFIADRNGSNPKLLFDDKPAGHLHFPTWSWDQRFIYFQRGPSGTNRQDIWRIPAAGGKPERITQHDTRVGYPALLDNRTLIYLALAPDGSGPWLYSTDVEQKVGRRISQGVEHYTSVSASADGHRLAAAVSSPSAGLWTVPIAAAAQAESGITRLPVSNVNAVAPRFGPGYLLYLSSTGGSHGLWKFQNSTATELWNGNRGAVAAAPAISADGKQLCVPIFKDGRGTLHLMTADGTDARAIAESLDVRQAPSWSPDGSWIAVAGTAAGQASQNNHIFLVPVTGGAPIQITETLSHTPVWSPDGRFIAYGKQTQGAVVELAAVTPDKKPVLLPEIYLSVAGDRFRFLPDGTGLVVMQGEFRRLNFWLLDLKSGQKRQLTSLKPGPLLRSFDVSPDGTQILFDRIQENSDIVLIDLKR